MGSRDHLTGRSTVVDKITGLRSARMIIDQNL